MAISLDCRQHPEEFLRLTLKRIQYFWYVIEGPRELTEIFAAWVATADYGGFRGDRIVSAKPKL